MIRQDLRQLRQSMGPRKFYECLQNLLETRELAPEDSVYVSFGKPASGRRLRHFPRWRPGSGCMSPNSISWVNI
jgi:hypothetical protein